MPQQGLAAGCCPGSPPLPSALASLAGQRKAAAAWYILTPSIHEKCQANCAPPPRSHLCHPAASTQEAATQQGAIFYRTSQPFQNTAPPPPSHHH